MNINKLFIKDWKKYLHNPTNILLLTILIIFFFYISKNFKISEGKGKAKKLRKNNPKSERKNQAKKGFETTDDILPDGGNLPPGYK